MTSTQISLATILVLGGTLIVSERVRSGVKASSLAFPLDAISSQVADWRGSPDVGPDPEILDRLKATASLSRVYRNRNRAIGLFIAFYANQRAGQSMHTPKACLPGHGWVIWDDQTVPLSTTGGIVHVNKYVVDDHNNRLLVFYWYQSSRRIVANEILDKWYLIGDALTGRDTGECLVRLIVHDAPDAEAMMSRFAGQIVPEIGRCLGARFGQS
jgi:EpsI family protein